jgi:hypothetical protein
MGFDSVSSVCRAYPSHISGEEWAFVLPYLRSSDLPLSRLLDCFPQGNRPNCGASVSCVPLITEMLDKEDEADDDE